MTLFGFVFGAMGDVSMAGTPPWITSGKLGTKGPQVLNSTSASDQVLTAHTLVTCRGLQSEGITIETEVCGYCASAAVDILLVGSRRFMGRHAYVLIHQLSQDIGGTFKTLQAEMRDAKRLMKQDRKIYREYANIPQGILDKLLTEDINLSARKCLKYGIVDELI